MTYNFESYLDTVRKNIANKKLHQPICAELESHLKDSADFYVEIGYDEETANRKALDDMGEPIGVAENMAKLHKLSACQIMTEVLFGLFVTVRICETLFCHLVWMLFPQTWLFVDEFVIMLFVAFFGFTLSLRHKRIVPTVMVALYFIAGMLSTTSFFYVIISQLAGDWENYLVEIELDSYPHNLNNWKLITSLILTVIVTALLIFMCIRIRKHITSPSVNTGNFKKRFYSISVPFLVIVLALSVATKVYLYQVDIREKAEFEKALTDLCDYCDENGKITKDDIQQVVDHFDYLEFKEYDNTGDLYSDYGYCDYYVSANMGGKSLAHPHLSIRSCSDGNLYITAEYQPMYNDSIFSAILRLKGIAPNSVFEEKLPQKNLFENIYEWYSPSSEFTDIVKEYSLRFEYSYDSEKDEVYYKTYIYGDEHPNRSHNYVRVDSGIITRASLGG